MTLYLVPAVLELVSVWVATELRRMFLLTNTFCHFPAIGEITERKLWDAGITTWESLLVQGRLPIKTFPSSWLHHASESSRRYDDRDPEYFVERLPSNCHWRLYPDFQDSCAFVDIETTGLPPFADITTAVLYDGHDIRWYVAGRNLEEFSRDIIKYKLLVTYNGKCFDVPVIEKQLRVKMPKAHIDLRFVLSSLGLRGGLKGCERSIGMSRPDMEGVDGLLAVHLWNEYQRSGVESVLETLLAYNIQDTVNLRELMIYAYNEKLKGTPFSGANSIPMCSPVQNPFQVDRTIVEKVRSQMFVHLQPLWASTSSDQTKNGFVETTWR